MAVKVGINGFGRIGRQVTKALFENYRGKFDLVAVNDLSNTNTNAHLFKYDSNYGVFPGTVEAKDGDLVIDGDRIKVLAEKDPSKLPWKDLGVDIVIESTGIFTDRAKAELHLIAGAKKVIISARARAAAMSIIPTTTGAAKAVSLVIPELKGKFDGYAMRVPTSTVSVVDLTAIVEKSITKEELFAAYDAAAAGPMKGFLKVVRDPLVSIDFKGDPYSSSVDHEFTNVYGKMVKIVTWYDNEWGYSNRVADLVDFMAKKGL
ncbi:MAG: aldehyde dehydrogenase [Anaerolineales bacterium]|nr:aldehyde dehydrogenase [Anaerolineales bacterium]